MSWRGRAAGAMSAQFSLALRSVLLQLLALRYLGVEGLGAFALVFSVTYITTAIIAGLVGNSLTVLNRSEVRTRAGLQAWQFIAANSMALVVALGSGAMGRLTLGQSALLGTAVWISAMEDSLRRLLMAVMHFWPLVVVDVCALALASGLVVGVNATAGEATLTTFIVALILGATIASLISVAFLPATERWIARGVSPDLASIWRYGSLRALQQLLRPTMLALTRVAATVAVGLALFGQLEVARIYVAPAMLAVGGITSYLFASYARDRASPLDTLLRRADAAVLGLTLAALLLGSLATMLVPHLGPVLVPGEASLDRVAVVGWSLYAAATAMVTPYGSLAAVRDHQGAVLAIRVGESVASVAGVIALLALGGSVFLVPMVLALSSVASGLALRYLLQSSGVSARDPHPLDRSST